MDTAVRLGGSVREGAFVPTIVACANASPVFTVLDAICKLRFSSLAKSEKAPRGLTFLIALLILLLLISLPKGDVHKAGRNNYGGLRLHNQEYIITN